ncbi:MAG TPA: nuclear transport factor 2 family protein [Pyrinomonadaceae bacterium]|nr:nuclear transport factor 2 family protein [Pyrinomonadaceae bacterium]
MRKNLRRAAVVLLLAACAALSSDAAGLKADAGGASGVAGQQRIADEIIARERASFEAWKRKDKAFYADYWAEDFTEFLPSSPYLDTRENILPKFEQLSEHWKIVDYSMYNPRVQVYGDTAVLTYNEMISGTYDGQPSTYTGKVTMVYVRQGGVWRGVHYHESANK